MSPKRQLTIIVSLIAVVIVAVWIVLFRSGVIVPVADSESAFSFKDATSDIEAEFETFSAQMEAYQERFEDEIEKENEGERESTSTAEKIISPESPAPAVSTQQDEE